SAFKSQAQIFATPPELLARPLHLENFSQLAAETTLPRAFFNSVVASAGHVTLALFLCSLAGYAFARFRDAPGNDALFAFVLGTILLMGSWNNLMWAFIVLRTKDMQTLPVVIYLLQGEIRTPWGMLMAGGLIATLPLVLAFLLFQRHFVRGITSGAIKA